MFPFSKKTLVGKKLHASSVRVPCLKGRPWAAMNLVIVSRCWGKCISPRFSSSGRHRPTLRFSRGRSRRGLPGWCCWGGAGTPLFWISWSLGRLRAWGNWFQCRICLGTKRSAASSGPWFRGWSIFTAIFGAALLHLKRSPRLAWSTLATRSLSNTC